MATFSASESNFHLYPGLFKKPLLWLTNIPVCLLFFTNSLWLADVPVCQLF